MSALTRVVMSFFVFILLFACGGNEDARTTSSSDTRARPLSISPDATMQVQLPFVDGNAYECLQNSNDTPTHNGTSTRYDLDFAMPVGTVVVAAAQGTIHTHSDASKTGGFGWFIAVDHGDGKWTMYAHLSGLIATDGQEVVAGQPIGYSGGRSGAPGAGTSTGPHLHFGVHIDRAGSVTGTSQPMAVYAFDRNVGSSDWFSTGMTSEFTCAVYSVDGKTKLSAGHVYESRSIGTTFSDYSCQALSGNGGVLCWKNNPVDCLDGVGHVWYHKDNEGAYLSEQADKHQRCSQVVGSANLFAYLEGGYGVGGTGPGTEIIPEGVAAPPPPDFVVKRVWLTDATGAERYTYGLSESFNTKAQAKNDGTGSCLSGEVSTITGHFYLSKGYKEDPHSGTGAWRRIDSTTTQCSNLGPGVTNTETKNTVINQWITEPGIYNIVYCIDHPLDDHNNGGQHQEKYESNNCSTEAVFTVTRRSAKERKKFLRTLNQIIND